MNQKLQRVMREIERAKAKIAELQASIPVLEKQKTELENAEIIKVFRSANVAPEELNGFITAYKENMAGNVTHSGQPAINTGFSEVNDDEE